MSSTLSSAEPLLDMSSPDMLPHLTDCPDCEDGSVEVCTGWRQTGSGYGDCDRPTRPWSATRAGALDSRLAVALPGSRPGSTLEALTRVTAEVGDVARVALVDPGGKAQLRKEAAEAIEALRQLIEVVS